MATYEEFKKLEFRVGRIKEVNEHGKCKCGLYFKSYDCWLKYDPTNSEKSLFI